MLRYVAVMFVVKDTDATSRSAMPGRWRHRAVGAGDDIWLRQGLYSCTVVWLHSCKSLLYVVYIIYIYVVPATAAPVCCLPILLLGVVAI